MKGTKRSKKNLNYVQLIMKMTFNRKHGENNKDKREL